MRRAVFAAAVLCAAIVVPSATGSVLTVGTYHGVRGQYSSIQAAVDAAKPGDWVLIGPGDYKTQHTLRVPGRPSLEAGILVRTRDIYIRGMSRGGVVIDGTKLGSATCSRKRSAQNFGLHGKSGLNGILIYKAGGVWVQNLTVCNFLAGSGDNGNEIWWNGGDDGGKIGGHGYYGSYLTTTSTFYDGERSAAQYGIFSSEWNGGEWYRTYSSNFSDSGYYIGACAQLCNQTIDDAHAEFDALGYSGSNSGGRLVVEHSDFDNDLDGINTNSQNGDEPSPQNGACPGNGISAITHTHSCLVFLDNYVHNNNDANVPAEGEAAQGPVGSGIVIAGGRNDTVMGNRIVDNDAWGVTLSPYPDSGKPCTGGTYNYPTSGGCLFEEWGDAIVDNKFGNNGDYGHPSDGDFQEVNFEGGHPTDCYHGNTEIDGDSLKPATAAEAQQEHPTCNGAAAPAGSTDPNFLLEGLCDSQIQLIPGQPVICPTGPYPRRTHVVMHPLPKDLPSMPNPCAGVPSNPWCSRNG